MINKKNVFLLFLLCSILISSCSEKKVSHEANNIEFNQLKIDTIAYIDGDTTRPSCKLKMKLEYPVKASDKAMLDTLQKIFIETSLGNQYLNNNFEAAANAYAKSYIDDYLKLSKEFDSDDYMNSFSFNYEESLQSQIYFNEDGFLNYSLDVFSYTGGAHGMGGTSCYAIYLKETKLLSIDEI